MSPKDLEAALTKPVTFKVTPKTDKSYSPSNSDEGVWFESNWCDKCQKDRVYRETNGVRGGCRILAYAVAFQKGDPEYPKEWIYGDHGPECTAFEPNRVYPTRGPSKHKRDDSAAVADLFGDKE